MLHVQALPPWHDAVKGKDAWDLVPSYAPMSRIAGMYTMLQRYPYEAGALGEVDSLPAMLHVQALPHSSWAHQRAVAPLQHAMHDAGTCRPSSKPPPQMPHHRAVEALQGAGGLCECLSVLLVQSSHA